jgi:hypothetical protein
MRTIVFYLIVLLFATNVFAVEFSAEGMTFELPDGFEETELVSISDEGGPYFPAYFVNEDKGIFVRLRRDVFEDYEPDWDSFLYTDAITYGANAIGHFPEGDEVDITMMDAEMISDLGVENGVIATFFLSEQQIEIQGITFELLVMLGVEQNLYLISFGFEIIPEGMDETTQTAEFLDDFMSSVRIK